MNKPLIYLLFVVLIAWLIGMGWCHNSTCPDCAANRATASVPAAIEKPANIIPLGLEIEDSQEGFLATVRDNLVFARNSCDFRQPLSDSLNNVLERTARHLQNNPNRKLILSGVFENVETNSCGDFYDLGIARAERVKNHLIKLGAPVNQIRIESSSAREMTTYRDSLLGGVDYLFVEEMVEDRLRGSNITLYFETSEQEINMTESQKQYFEELRAYLEQNPNAKALVTGHTDDQGSDRGNIRLSRKRSEFVRDYMVEQGISMEQIVNKGMGPDVPIASNATSEGRALNRRVEITLE